MASFNWSLKAPRNLATNPPPKKLVAAFIRSLQIADSGYSDLGLGGTYVCSFRFADLRQQGLLSLVAGIGISDRPSCTGIVIIDKTRSGFEFYGSGGVIGAGSDISAALEDLRHDGRLEFELATTLGELPQRCIATWSAIYAWTGDNYTNVSRYFKDFYKQELDRLNKEIPSLGPVPNSTGLDLSDKECVEAEAFAVQRFLGESRDAGLEQAIRLASSKDTGERQFSTDLLGGIGTMKARHYLEMLAKDPEASVSLLAKDYLKILSKGPVELAPDSFIHVATFVH